VHYRRAFLGADAHRALDRILVGIPQPVAGEAAGLDVAELQDFGHGLCAIGHDVLDHRGDRHAHRLADLGPHDRAPSGATFDQAGIVKAGHRASHRDARHAEHAGELFLGRQRFTLGVAPRRNAVRQHQVDLVMQRRAHLAGNGDRS
jgi:hypothetical protein